MNTFASELTRPQDFISEGAQTTFRDSESQYLNWDTSKMLIQHPSNFPGGKGLHYPILYDPAWPVHIAARKKDIKLSIMKEKKVVGSCALKGMTLNETKRRKIKKTILFPHQNIDLPFRQPIRRVVKEPNYEQFQSLTLQAIEELEPHVIHKSLLEKLPQHDAKDKIARALAIRKLLVMSPPYINDPKPPIPSCRKSKRQWSQTKSDSLQSQGTQGPVANGKCEPLQIVFVNERQMGGMHGAPIGVSQVKNCEIHCDSGIIQNDEKEVLEGD